MSERTVLITGVSSGLGQAFANELSQAGYKVVGTVRKKEAAAEFENFNPGHAIARILDVTNAAAVEQTVREIEANIGPIHALINNAGYAVIVQRLILCCCILATFFPIINILLCLRYNIYDLLSIV